MGIYISSLSALYVWAFLLQASKSKFFIYACLCNEEDLLYTLDDFFENRSHAIFSSSPKTESAVGSPKGASCMAKIPHVPPSRSIH